MKTKFISFMAFAFIAVGVVPAEEPFQPTDSYQVRKIDGWTAMVHPQLAKDRAELLDKTMTLLGHQLYQIDRVVPKHAATKLRTVRIWVENFDPHHPCMCYHPDPGWLRGKKLNPDKAKGVEIANPTNFLTWTIAQPWMVLHEMAHAYHDQFVDGGFANKELRAAHVRLVESKEVDDVLHINGKNRRHYALNNPMEYFAESSEAYFGTNDFFPFVKSELKKHDPAMFELVGKLWGTAAK